MHSGNLKKRFCGVQLRDILEEYVIPFFLGLASVSIFLWARGLLDEHRHPQDLTSPFLLKNDQVFLKKRHNIPGIKWKSGNVLEFTIQANASEKFETVYTHYLSNQSLSGSAASPGTIWPWSRLEKEAPSLPIVWVVTPTFRNPYQYAELTRVAQALYPARRFVHWILVDDSEHAKKFKHHIRRLQNLIHTFGVNYTILRSKPRPSTEKVKFNPKGVEARRTGLEYIRQNNLRGVVFFGDDDNTYDSDIFRQMQATKTISIWPTGAITQFIISSPVVNNQGNVVDFFDGWIGNRKFPVDFASFAINTDLIHDNLKANIPWVQGYEETYFLESLNVSKSDFLPLAANATEVLTWHTKTVKIRERMDPGPKGTVYPASVQALMTKYDFLFPPAKLKKIGG